MKRLFENKVALITGGTSGIGKAASRELAREGAKVVLANFENSSRFISVDVVLVDSGGQTQKVHRPHAI